MSRLNHCHKKSDPGWAARLSEAILPAVAPPGPALPVWDQPQEESLS